ncbi:MAG: hypothetical protein IJH95_01640 [Mogibacterium sp.]|nr:hypothetical protein [Mogibacterium sp.]
MENLIGRIRETLADEAVNTERQKNVDLGKSMMVIMLPFIHTIIECTSDEGLASGIPYLFDSVIGSAFSAPMYMFCMGIGINYSRNVTFRMELSRGLRLIGVFYLLNTCRFLIPYLIGYAISGDREHFIDPLMYRWLGNDILLFASLAIMTSALFRLFRISDRAMILISLCATLFTSAVYALTGDSLDTGSKYGNIFLGYIIGTDDATGYVISDFPLLTWLIFPVCGYVFGKVLLRVKDRNKFYSLISPPFLLIALIYFPLGIYKGWGMFGEGQNCYYHMMIWDVAVSLCLTLGMLGVWSALSYRLPQPVMSFFTEVSRNITSIYCIHWVFVRTITNVILYIIRGTQEMPVGVTMLLSVLIFIVSYCLARFYRQLKSEFMSRKVLL